MSSDDNLSLEHQLCVALYGASRAVIGGYRPLLDDIGLTYSQYAVMLGLWEQGTTTLRDLGLSLHLDSGTLSPLVKRLEGRGLVTRSRDPHDERVLRVTITEAGRSLRDQACAAQRRVETMTALPPEVLAALRDQLNELSDQMWRARAVEADVPGSAA